MRYVLSLPVLASLALAAHPVLLAQDEPSQPVVTEGSRVRVTSPLLEKRLQGTVVSLDESQLVILPDRRDTLPARVPWDQLTALDVSTGRKSVVLRNAAIGFGSGFAVGFTIGVAGGETESGLSGAGVGAVVGLLFGTIGGVIGTITGIGAKVYRWEEVDLSTLEPVVSLIPQGNHSPAFRIGLRLRI